MLVVLALTLVCCDMTICHIVPLITVVVIQTVYILEIIIMIIIVVGKCVQVCFTFVSVCSIYAFSPCLLVDPLLVRVCFYFGVKEAYSLTLNCVCMCADL